MKNALIIGGNSYDGIGGAISNLLCRKNIRVFVNGSNDHKTSEFVKSLQEDFKEVYPLICDITNNQKVRLMFDDVKKITDCIDYFIYNAAPNSSDENLQLVSIDEWQLNMNVILSGLFYCSKYVCELMKIRNFGKIVIISSNAAINGSWGRNIAYAAAKAGLHGFIKRLALEMGEYGINVNGIAPSQIDTGRVKMNGRRSKESILRSALKHVPLKRVGLPVDVANLVYFLISEESSYITGQIIQIDGGSSIANNSTKPHELTNSER
jgi:3-oxoacyl-[acyl-carrier protein] reductase